MHRKIPGKKHKGVKNPHEQAAKRLASIAKKINRPPKCPDEQEVPQKVLEIMKYQEKLKHVKNKQKKPKKKKSKLMSTADFIEKEIDMPGMTRPVKNPEIICQRPGESDMSFMQRLDESTQRSLREAEFEDQFDVRVKRDEMGEVVDVVADKQHDDSLIKSIAENRKSKKNKTSVLSKYEKKKLKLKAKEEIKNEQKHLKDFADYKDEVKFGEVVHRPPNLTVAPKVKLKTKNQDRRPGCRDLLMKTMLDGNNEKGSFNFKKAKTAPPESMARKKMLEEERNRVVNLYRQMKSKK